MESPEGEKQLLQLDEEGLDQEPSPMSQLSAGESHVNECMLGSIDSTGAASPASSGRASLVEIDQQQSVPQVIVTAASKLADSYDEVARRFSVHRDVSTELGRSCLLAAATAGLRYEPQTASDREEEEEEQPVGRKLSSRTSVYPSRVSTISREAFGNYSFFCNMGA